MKYLLIASLLLTCCSTQTKPALQPEPQHKVTNPTFDPSGTWHANSNGWPVTITIAKQGDSYIGFMCPGESPCNRELDNIAVDAANLLEFRYTADGATQWYRVAIADGLMIGRFSHENTPNAAKPSAPLAYTGHVTGWNENEFSAISPVVFDINGNGFRGRLRIDKSGDGFTGRLKMYAFQNSTQECPEEEIAVGHWDGEKIAFTRGPQEWIGLATGRYISGSFTHAGQTFVWSGRRAEVLTYGLTAKTPEDRSAWQERTRRQLYRLMMAGNPQPISVNVEILADDQPPIASAPYPARDDDPVSYPQNYSLTELRLTYTVGATTRTVHAYLAKPNAPGPHPLVVALNGHLGSAYKVMDGGSLYWYGDAWARRGYMVLAIDIGHRPSSDVIRARSLNDLSTYLGYPDDSYPGDDPEHGNGLRPAISTEWEEDGERVWDVMRAIDYAVSRSDVDAGKIVVTGLSLGGEVASYVGALDPRVAVTIAASGPAADLSVFKYLRRVGHCVNWSRADIREYIDQADMLALIVPRPVIVETGQVDRTYSEYAQPFAGSKQMVRRAMMAYGDGPLIHFLHPLGHEYRAGVVTYTVNDDQGSSATATDGRTVFDCVREWLR
jgi:dienelactone hydrolase